MSKASELAKLIGNINAGGGGAGRNFIDNGAMRINQRGATTNISASINTIDRYRLNMTALDEFRSTVSQSTDAPSGFATSMKVDVTTAESSITSGERCSIEQRIEARFLQRLLYGTSDAKTATLSFFVKSSVAGKYGINIRHHDALQNKGLDYTINAPNTWERKEISFTGYTPTAINDDNGIGLWFRWMLIVGTDFQNTAVANQWVSNSTNYYVTTGMQSTWGTSTDHNFYLTGIQLEIGENSTSFEHVPFSQELSKCQRYYCKSYNYTTYAGDSTANGAVFDRFMSGTNVSNRTDMATRFPVPMRANPDITPYTLEGTVDNISDCSTGVAHVNNRAVTSIHNIGQNGFGGFSCGSFDNTGGYHYEADANL